MGAVPTLAVDTHWYRMCGLAVSSCVELPGAATLGVPVDRPDAVVKYGAVPGTLSDSTARGPNWEAAPGRVLMEVPGVARILIQGGREALLDLAPGRGPADVALVITGPVLGALLQQRGYLVLHAAAVAAGSAAVLFCGPSALGKSALVAALSQTGLRLLSDDLCRIDFDGGAPIVRLKLWADVIQRFSLEYLKGAAVRPGLQKYWVDPPTPAVCEPLPLRAIYFLRWTQLPGTSGIEPVGFLDALTMLRAHTYRRRLVRALGIEQRWLDACVFVAKRAGAWLFSRERRFEALPNSLALLESHWGR